MALIDQLRDDDPGARESGKLTKGTGSSQSPRKAGPAGKATVGSKPPYRKGGSDKAGKDLDGGSVSPRDTRRGQAKMGSKAPYKASNPKIVTPKSTTRKGK